MMKAEQVKEKALEIYKKIGKKTIIIFSACLVIAIAVVLNFILWGAAEDTSKQLAVDLSDLSAVEGAADTAAADDGSGYFAEMALSRTQARDEAIEVLNGVINSESAVDEMKAEAQSELNRIAKDMENEANIESLVRSKGFEECVAVISGVQRECYRQIRRHHAGADFADIGNRLRAGRNYPRKSENPRKLKTVKHAGAQKNCSPARLFLFYLLTNTYERCII